MQPVATGVTLEHEDVLARAGKLQAAAKIMGASTTVRTRTAPHLSKVIKTSERVSTGKIVPLVESRVNKKSEMGPQKERKRRPTYLPKVLNNTADLFRARFLTQYDIHR